MRQAISVSKLSKTYLVDERAEGLKASLQSLFRRQKKEVKAVREISFSMDRGEIVGFLGPNGAGKTTTLKMLAGLLYPTSGDGTVLGYTPHLREKDYLRQMTLVTGQRNQLVWDIPAADSFALNKAIYEIPEAQYQETFDEYVQLLELDELIRKPVRNLSLGERMKVEIAGALLHRPRVLFLDEPTLGLDITMQRRIRKFIAEYNQRHGATVLLTSHYMADVVALCRRVIVIHHGRILFDGDLSQLADRTISHKRILVKHQNSSVDFSPYGQVLEQTADSVALLVPKERIPGITSQLLSDVPVIDLSVEDPPIEDVIEQIFAVSPDEATV